MIKINVPSMIKMLSIIIVLQKLNANIALNMFQIVMTILIHMMFVLWDHLKMKNQEFVFLVVICAQNAHQKMLVNCVLLLVYGMYKVNPVQLAHHKFQIVNFVVLQENVKVVYPAILKKAIKNAQNVD